MDSPNNQMHSVLVRLLPAAIRQRVEHRPGLIKILDNIGWLFFDKLLRMGVGLLVGVWVARYLGPQQFGLLNYALAFTGLFGAIATLGLQGIVVRDIVRDPAGAPLTLGTAALLQLIGGVVSFLLILGAIAYLRPDDPLAGSIVAILGAMMLFKAFEIAVYWFESQVQSKYAVWVQNGVFLVAAVIKVIFILNQVSLIYFVWLMLLEGLAVALILLIVMGRVGYSLSSLKISSGRAKVLLKDAWPLALSSVAVFFYMKIDQIMLGQIVGDEEVGVFSAATRLSEVWYFIPMAIFSSVFPAVLEAKKRSESEYIERLQKIYDLVVVFSVCVALPMTFAAQPLVELLFGKAYAGAGIVLSIHIWASVFVCLGIASSQYLLTENRQIISLQRTLGGCVANILLNFILIPKFGSLGAAIATVVSQGLAAFLFDFIQSETRLMFLMKAKSLNPLRLVGLVVGRTGIYN